LKNHPEEIKILRKAKISHIKIQNKKLKIIDKIIIKMKITKCYKINKMIMINSENKCKIYKIYKIFIINYQIKNNN